MNRKNISSELREYLTEKEMMRLMRAPSRIIDLTKPRPPRPERGTNKVLATAPEIPSAVHEPLSTLDDLSDEAFMVFVFEEAQDRVHTKEAELLRTPEVAERWHWCLGQLLARVNSRLSIRARDQASRGREYHRWKTAVLEQRAALEERRREVAPAAARSKKQRHEENVAGENSAYFHQLCAVLDFLKDDTAFVYSAWPARDQLREDILRTIREKERS